MKTLFTSSLFLLAFWANAQSLDDYVNQALTNNIDLQRAANSVAQSQARLNQAKALFFPQISIEGRFSAAQGGRTIDIPAGDLVNPAYQNLNALNQQAAGNDPTYPAFPSYGTINNESINFLRATEQETVVRLDMPLYNQQILRNKQLQENLVAAEGEGLQTFKRNLEKDVRTAYYQYAQAALGREVYENALALVQENLRVAESLKRHHQVTAADVYAAQAQLANIQQSLSTAIQQERTAQAYFNTLLNQAYETPINLPTDFSELVVGTSALAEAQALAIQRRPELSQLNYYVAVADQQTAMAKGNRLPTINLRADYGVQGTTYNFGPDDDFFLGSVVFSIPLFNRSTSAKVQEANLAQANVRQQKESVQQQIGLQIIQQYYRLEAASERITQARAEQTASSEAYRLVEKLYEQGQANQVTLSDARTRLTNAELQVVATEYDYLTQQALWQWVTGA